MILTRPCKAGSVVNGDRMINAPIKQDHSIFVDVGVDQVIEKTAGDLHTQGFCRRGSTEPPPVAMTNFFHQGEMRNCRSGQRKEVYLTPNRYAANRFTRSAEFLPMLKNVLAWSGRGYRNVASAIFTPESEK